MTESEVDFLDAVATEMERSGGGIVDRDRLATEMYGSNLYDGPPESDFHSWVESLEADYGDKDFGSGPDVEF